MAMTLAEESVLEDQPLRKGVIDTLLMDSDLMRVIPFDSIAAFSVTHVRPNDISTPGYRSVGATSVTEGGGRWERVTNDISLIAHDLDVDKAIIKATGTMNRAGEARALQTQQLLKALAYQFNESFVNGSPEDDINEFEGIKSRVEAIGGNQVVDLASGGDSLKVTSSDANRRTLLDAIDQGVEAVDGNKPVTRPGQVVILGNNTTRRRLTSIYRNLGLLNTQEDAQGRFFFSVGAGGPVVLDAGIVNDSSLTGATPTKVITDTEDPGDAGNDSTSLYIMRLQENEYLWGIQEYPMEVTDIGELQSAPAFRTRVDWNPGLAQINPRAIFRLKGFKMAA